MWSAPESPSVVRSIFSTPEKISDDVKSPENDKVNHVFCGFFVKKQAVTYIIYNLFTKKDGYYICSKTRV